AAGALPKSTNAITATTAQRRNNPGDLNTFRMSINDSYPTISSLGLLVRGNKRSRASVFGCNDDAIVECPERIIRRNIPGGIPHPGGVRHRRAAAADRPSTGDLLAVRQDQFNRGAVFIRHPLAAFGIEHLEAHHHAHAALEHTALNTRLRRSETVLAWPRTGQRLNIKKEWPDGFVIRGWRRERRPRASRRGRWR